MNRTIHSHLAYLIRNARASTGLSQGEFAELLGKSQAVVSRYEKGYVEPPGEVVMHCVQLLGSIPPPLSPPLGTWDETLRALEAAVAIVKSLRDASVDLPLCDNTVDTSKRPRLA